MTATVSVFGFGSYFQGGSNTSDIDIFLIHDDLSDTSCALAIKCKQHLLQAVDGAHITMLSQREEQHFDFVTTARAKLLGTVRDGRIEDDLAAICSQYLALLETAS